MHGPLRDVGCVVAVATLIVACGGVVTESTAPISEIDAGIVAHDAGRAGPQQNQGIGCPAPATSNEIIEVNPPKDSTQGSCTDAELAKVAGVFSDIVKVVSPTCAGCLFTEANDVTNTQFFVWADAMHDTVSVENFGACMGSPLSGGNPACGKAAEELESCLDAECPVDGSGASLCEYDTHDQCAAVAVKDDCFIYDTRRTAACGGLSALIAISARCFDTNGGVAPGMRLLCGGTSLADAGPDAADAGGD